MTDDWDDIKKLRGIQIETTSWCNRSCVFCPNSVIPKDREMLMRWDVIECLVGELRRIGFKNRVHLYGNGEPLSDPRFREILVYVRKELPENHLFISTNGDYLSGTEQIRELMGLGLDELHVSHYDDRNHRLADEAIPGVHHFGVGTLGLEFYNRGGHVKIGSLMNHRNCWWAWGKAYVNYRGDWCLCCSDWKGETVWGNVMDKPLDEIWDGEQFRHYRQTHATGRGKQDLPFCNQCNR